MNYRDTWDLSTIPDAPFQSENARRNGIKGGRPIDDEPDPAKAEAKRKQREYKRDYRRRVKK
jgi:hypothetical protein